MRTSVGSSSRGGDVTGRRRRHALVGSAGTACSSTHGRGRHSARGSHSAHARVRRVVARGGRCRRRGHHHAAARAARLPPVVGAGAGRARVAHRQSALALRRARLVAAARHVALVPGRRGHVATARRGRLLVGAQARRRGLIAGRGLVAAARCARLVATHWRRCRVAAARCRWLLVDTARRTRLVDTARRTWLVAAARCARLVAAARGGGHVRCVGQRGGDAAGSGGLHGGLALVAEGVLRRCAHGAIGCGRTTGGAWQTGSAHHVVSLSASGAV
mmetsp:Transcript_40835/g.102799  ORF Transcript_40835/g.102799 Transcript_40835/m.102799 type:complete len:275 (+) Transcript_40835:509-1333(+)